MTVYRFTILTKEINKRKYYEVGYYDKGREWNYVKSYWNEREAKDYIQRLRKKKNV